uniref:Uncharacterized protein n=1 Tax=Triticum urartu TaxID=4572 RepID=A0A8R7QAJ7_TRIUA
MNMTTGSRGSSGCRRSRGRRAKKSCEHFPEMLAPNYPLGHRSSGYVRE